MDIQGMGVNTNIYSNVLNTSHTQNSDFKQLFDKITGGEIAQEIRENYNVTLKVGSIGNIGQLLNSYDMQYKNYVGISQETLSRMEKDPVLKKKVLSAIEEFCSPEEQAKVNALQPPVKSAGMIVYPDGNAFYWLEGYPNEVGGEKTKKTVNDNFISNLLQKYQHTDIKIDNNLEAAMQILASSYRRQDEVV